MTKLNISNGKDNFTADFYVVHLEFPIPGDGIIGKPFLTENHVIINIGKGEITFQNQLPLYCNRVAKQ